MRHVMQRSLMAITALSVLALAESSFAHHSTNLYFDVTKTIEVQGTVTALKLQNPHSQLRFMAQDANGQTKEWIAETHNAAALVRLGWRQDTLMVGDKITAKGNPSRTEGQTTMYLVSVVTPNGKTITPNAPFTGATR
jgi:hypothetical protein